MKITALIPVHLKIKGEDGAAHDVRLGQGESVETAEVVAWRLAHAHDFSKPGPLTGDQEFRQTPNGAGGFFATSQPE